MDRTDEVSVFQRDEEELEANLGKEEKDWGANLTFAGSMRSGHVFCCCTCVISQLLRSAERERTYSDRPKLDTR
jgi:hypothetical protein